MRVELLKHPSNAVLHKLVLVDGVDIETIYGNLSDLQLAQRRVLAKVQSQLCLCRRRQEKRQQQKGGMEKMRDVFHHNNVFQGASLSKSVLKRQSIKSVS